MPDQILHPPEPRPTIPATDKPLVRPPAPRGGLPRLLWPLLALVLLLLYNLIFTPNFFAIEIRDAHLYGTLIDIIDRAAPVTLVALGMTLVIATGGVDLSVGAIMAIAGAYAAYFITEQNYAFAMVLFLTLAISLLAGAWNGMLVSLFGIQPIVATLILMVAGRGIAQLRSGGQIITFENPGLTYIANGYLFALPFTLTLVLLTFAATAILTRGTAMGLFIEASGNNPSASHHAGVNVRAVKFFVYVFSGFCAGVAGLVAASDIKAADANNAGLYLELDAILAVVIGGTALAGGRFSLLGSIIGAFIIQTLTTTILTTRFFGHDVPPQATLIIKALVVLIVCLLQSEELRRRMLKWRKSR